MDVQFDLNFYLATGKNRREVNWKNREWAWSEFVNKVSQTHFTAETISEYMASKKDRQDEIKDIGGFVGGYLTNGKRKKDAVAFRRLLTLDVDFASPDFWELFTMFYGCASVVYSTHKHTPEKPRLRLILLLDRDVYPDEYEAVGRCIAGTLGIEMFDDTTYQPERLMYWPSTAKNAEYFFRFQDGKPLCADDILSTYKNWHDTSEWPMSSRVNKVISQAMKKQEFPLEKSGIVGAFCRTYTIQEVIETFLSDEYTPCDIENRYTYMRGSTSAGLVVYDDVFAYSHHSTDPCSGKLCNAFDLVRLHKFGDRDENVSEKTNISKYPSFQAMEEFAAKDRAVASAIAKEKLINAGEDFSDIISDTDIENDWIAEMDIDKKGNYLATPKNADLIMCNDPNLKGCFAYNLFFDRKSLLRLPPWREKNDTEMFIRDDDESNLRKYVSEEPWSLLKGRQLFTDALDIVCRKNAFHPVRNYLDTLVWDGVPRLETLFSDYIGAEDTALNRSITKIAFTAAVYRIYEPGTKYDQVVVLVGTQGCGKSTIIERMAVCTDWFSNSLPNLNEQDKAAAHLRGKFIIEIGELVSLKKAEVEAIKNFLSKTADDFRPAFGKNELHRPRQCIFFATTNEEQFLRDSSGERRYWPIKVASKKSKYNLWKDLTPEVVGQIWAEAVCNYKERLSLQLSSELAVDLRSVQEEYKNVDEWQGIIEEFMTVKLPSDWSSRNNIQRRGYFTQKDILSAEGVLLRDRVCIAEILNECVSLGIIGIPGTVEKSRIRNVMKNIEGWERGKNKIDAGEFGRQWGWIRSQKEIDSVKENLFEN